MANNPLRVQVFLELRKENPKVDFSDKISLSLVSKQVQSNKIKMAANTLNRL